MLVKISIDWQIWFELHMAIVAVLPTPSGAYQFVLDLFSIVNWLFLLENTPFKAYRCMHVTQVSVQLCYHQNEYSESNRN